MSRKLTVLFLLLLTALWGCQQEDTLRVRPRNDYVEAGAGSVFVTVTAAGAWTLSLEFPEGMDAWAKADPAEGVGDQAGVRVRYEANLADEPRLLTLVLRSGKRESRASLGQSGKTERPIPGNYGYDQVFVDWLELPATQRGDGLELLVHDMYGGKYQNRQQSGVRNWSCYWDNREKLSLWVAYPLNNGLIGSGSRSDAWGYDALLPADEQPRLIERSYGGGWTRGHQIPSADRLSHDANVSTFVPTNMTPQEYNFNGGIWAGLEGKVRAYASAAKKTDTLYVVTGCQYANSTQFTGGSSGFSVRVPTHYFKALLYKGGAAEAADTDGYLAAGFFLPHDKAIAEGNFLRYICTIDELEKQTGIDFFPNLVKRVGQETADAVEAATPGSFWK